VNFTVRGNAKAAQRNKLRKREILKSGDSFWLLCRRTNPTLTFKRQLPDNVEKDEFQQKITIWNRKIIYSEKLKKLGQ
jgi:hypothetical protein